MSRYLMPLAALLFVCLAASPLRAERQQLRTVQSAAEAVHTMVGTLPRIIPPEQVREAAGVIVIPHVLRGGLLLGGCFGRGVALVRKPDRTWGLPVFVTLSGGSVGGQVGIETTDLVLLFRTTQALEQALAGSFTLDGGVAVAVGPLAGEAEGNIRTDWSRADVVCYPHSRGGLFAGLSLAGAWLSSDTYGNEEFARMRSLDQTIAYQALTTCLTRLAVPPVLPPPPPQQQGKR